MFKSFISMLAFLVALHATIEVAHAQDPPADHNWVGDAQHNGDWGVSANWDAHTLPIGSSIVEIGWGSPVISSPAQANDLRIVPKVGYYGAQLLVDDSLTTQRTFVNSTGSYAGEVRVQFQDALWTNMGDLIVGSAGFSLPYQGATNLLDIGYGGVVSSGRGILADYAGSGGTVHVHGTDYNVASAPAAKWTINGELRVGNFGAGTLNVDAGGIVTNTVGYIGTWGSSTGTATVSSGSQWTNTGDLYVGSQSTAASVMTVQSGGLVTSARGFIGDFGPFVSTATAIGQVTVTGNNSKWDSGTELRVGNAGNGTLTIQNGGTVRSGVGRIAMHPNSTGNASISGTGSIWNMTGDLTIGSGGRLSMGGGVVIAPLGVTIASSGSVADRGLHGSGTVAGNVINSGNVHPSNPLAPLSINGTYTQTSTGALNTDLDADGIGKLVVNGVDGIDGNVTLAGNLNVTNLDFPFWEPAIGQSYDLLDWTGTISGKFDSISLPGIHGGKMWNKSRLYTTGVISVSNPGDFTDDFRVDGSDYVAWRRSGGIAAEYDLWRANFGTTFAAGSFAATLSSPGTSIAIPEPSAVALIVVGALVVSIWSARRDMSRCFRPRLHAKRLVPIAPRYSYTGLAIISNSPVGRRTNEA